jgi:DNA-directed RNA polymerase subunit beta'
MRTLTPGRLLFERIVPPEFRDGVDDQPIGSDGVKKILQSVAEQAPERYNEISHQLLKLGAKASIEVPASFTLEDLKPPIDKAAIIAEVQAKEDAIRNDKTLSPKQRTDALIKLYAEQSAAMPEKVFQASAAKGSNLAKMVASGARGNKGQLNSNIGADWLMLDADSRPIPVPIKSSYSEGLSPAEYYASAYGTRRGLLSTKFSVQEAGYLSKQLAAASHDLIVSAKDCETSRGYPTDPSDNDNIGAVMATPAGGFPAGTIITSRVLKQLKDNKVGKMTVRSPLTCTAKNGICAVCAGIKEKNRFPEIGDRVGLSASSSVGEPLSQGTLSEKHSGGVASSSGKAVSAFKQIDSIVQVPEVFPNGATVAEADGIVSKIEEAPQGGHFVYVGDKQHYVGRGVDISVKRGDTVEAGDSLSSGVPNPYDIVKHKGIGQGRVYFVNAMRQAMKSNNIANDRRQIEVLGRSLINHVKVTDPDGYGAFLPDDIIEYSSIEDNIPDGATKMPVAKSVGKYLARPTLHYSIGTRITPSVAKTLDESDEKEIDVLDSSPGFEPEAQRVMDIPAHKTDWMAQFAGSNLKKRILSDVHSGTAISDPRGPSFVPGLARGAGFGTLPHTPEVTPPKNTSPKPFT